MFKTELHCHSSEASPCSTDSAESLVEIYTKAGYDTVILTNHFSPCVFDLYKCKNIGEYVDIFMQAFKKMKEVAKDKLTILCGAEIRFNCNANDYLWFGDFEDFMRKTPDIFDYTPDRFHEVCKQNGWLFIQAHPFRHTMKVVDPKMVDGVEVYNAKNESFRNFIADKWADHFGLIKTSGTDIHKPHETPSGGILTEKKMETMQDVLEVIKSGNYKLVTE